MVHITYKNVNKTFRVNFDNQYVNVMLIAHLFQDEDAIAGAHGYGVTSQTIEEMITHYAPVKYREFFLLCDI